MSETQHVATTEGQRELYHPSIEHVLRFFKYEHLPEGRLRDMSMIYCQLAFTTASLANRADPETTVALRKLLEAKDAAVRACIPRPLD